MLFFCKFSQRKILVVPTKENNSSLTQSITILISQSHFDKRGSPHLNSFCNFKTTFVQSVLTVSKMKRYLYAYIFTKKMSTIKPLTLTTFNVLTILNNAKTLSLSTESGTPVREPQPSHYLTREQIMTAYKSQKFGVLSKQSLSNVLRQRHFFLTASNDLYKITFGLSEEGYRAFHAHYMSTVFPQVRTQMARAVKTFSQKFFTGNPVSLDGKDDLLKFYQYFNNIFLGTRENPFSISVTLKPEFQKDPVRFYSTFMDKSLAEEIAKS